MALKKNKQTLLHSLAVQTMSNYFKLNKFTSQKETELLITPSNNLEDKCC